LVTGAGNVVIKIDVALLCILFAFTAVAEKLYSTPGNNVLNVTVILVVELVIGVVNSDDVNVYE
jgi:hypothetical protein